VAYVDQYTSGSLLGARLQLVAPPYLDLLALNASIYTALSMLTGQADYNASDGVETQIKKCIMMICINETTLSTSSRTS